MEARFYQLDEYLALDREPQPWVIHSLVPVGGLVNVFGKPKTGKSFIVLDWCKAVAQGAGSWFGYQIQKSGPVAYLQVDTPREEWARRLEHVRKECARDGIPLWIADMWLVPNFPVNVLEKDDPTILWLRAELERIQPVMIVIDTLREVHGGDEDNSTVMRNVISALVGACRPSAIVIVSHARKDQAAFQDTGGDDMMDQARGSSYVAGRMDVIVKVSPKRMMFKGRATGQVTEVIQQDKETGWISLVRDEDGSDKAIEDIWRSKPGLSLHAMAEILAKKMGYSVSTGERRMRAWRDKLDQEEKERHGRQQQSKLSAAAASAGIDDADAEGRSGDE